MFRHRISSSGRRLYIQVRYGVVCCTCLYCCI